MRKTTFYHKGDCHFFAFPTSNIQFARGKKGTVFLLVIVIVRQRRWRNGLHQRDPELLPQT